MKILPPATFNALVLGLALAPETPAIAADPAPPPPYKQCESCHAYTPGAAHGIGPNLRGVVGRKVGTAEGFAYSPQARSAGFVWTEERLRALFADPKGYKKHLRKAHHAWPPSAKKPLERDVIPFLRAISPAEAAK